MTVLRRLLDVLRVPSPVYLTRSQRRAFERGRRG